MCATLSTPILLQDRFAATLLGLCEEANTHGLRDRLMAPLLGLLCRRLYGVLARITQTLARLQAGRAPMLRREGTTAVARRAPAVRPSADALRLRYGWAWMIRMAPRVAQYAPQLQVLLDDSEMQAALAASPSLRQALRPLCRGLAFPIPSVMAETHARRRARAERTGRSADGSVGVGATVDTQVEGEGSPSLRPVVAWRRDAPPGSIRPSIAISNHDPSPRHDPGPNHHPRPAGRASPDVAPAVLRVFTR